MCACGIASDGAIRGRRAGEATVQTGLVHTRTVGAEFVHGAIGVIHTFNANPIDTKFVRGAIIIQTTSDETFSVNTDFVGFACTTTSIGGNTAACEDRRNATQKDTNPE